MKNISIFKNRDKVEGSNQPDYRLVASWKDEQGNWQSVTVGSLWKDTNENGPSLKGSMKDAFTTQDGKDFPGFKITRDEPEPRPSPDTPDTTWKEGTGSLPVDVADDVPF